jgi:hypothetical protein
MADWLDKVKSRVSDNLALQSALQLAQSENVGLLCATGQHSEAVRVCRQQISCWECVQRDMPQADVKPYLAGGYLTLIGLLTDMHKMDEANQVAAEARNNGLDSPPTLARFARNLVLAVYLEPLPIAWRIGPAVPDLAVEAAQMAVDASPNDGLCWSALGAAKYCAGDWRGATESLGRSMDLGAGGDAADWFFVAMAHWQLGQPEEARVWYDKAIVWMEKHEPTNDELQRVRAAATGLIGISGASRPTGTDNRRSRS